jgi:hypothetical protein
MIPVASGTMPMRKRPAVAGLGHREEGREKREARDDAERAVDGTGVFLEHFCLPQDVMKEG